jgi:hypothetical protein
MKYHVRACMPPLNLLVIISFGVLPVSPLSVWRPGIGALVSDLGRMAAFVSHQHLANGLYPSARSRLHGMLLTGTMAGMALGPQRVASLSACMVARLVDRWRTCRHRDTGNIFRSCISKASECLTR